MVLQYLVQRVQFGELPLHTDTDGLHEKMHIRKMVNDLSLRIFCDLEDMFGHQPQLAIHWGVDCRI